MWPLICIYRVACCTSYPTIRFIHVSKRVACRVERDRGFRVITDAARPPPTLYYRKAVARRWAVARGLCPSSVLFLHFLRLFDYEHSEAYANRASGDSFNNKSILQERVAGAVVLSE